MLIAVSKSPRVRGCLFGLALFALLVLHVEARAASPAPSKFVPAPPCSPLLATAKVCNIPLDQFDRPTPDADLNPGDSVTALLTLFEKGDRRTQWILYLQVLDGDIQAPAKATSPMTLYSSRGSKLEFPSAPARASLRTLGPFAEPHPKRKQPRALDKTDHFFLNKGFLALGFDEAAGVILRLRKLNAGGSLNFHGAPFSEAAIRKGRELAEKVQLTDEEERALGGSLPALISYLNILQHAAGLEEVASKVVARPSLWSMVKERGVTAIIVFRREQVGAAPETLANARYQVPLAMRLNGQPALDFSLFVTAAAPPLLVCGGVVGLLAEKPGDPATYLTLHVVSARRGEEKK